MAEEVDLELKSPLVEGQGLHRCVDGNAGVVDDRTQTSLLGVGVDSVDERIDVIGDGDVEDDWFDVCCADRVGIARASDAGQDVVALLGQCARGCCSHAGGCT